MIALRRQWLSAAEPCHLTDRHVTPPEGNATVHFMRWKHHALIQTNMTEGV